MRKERIESKEWRIKKMKKTLNYDNRQYVGKKERWKKGWRRDINA